MDITFLHHSHTLEARLTNCNGIYFHINTFRRTGVLRTVTAPETTALSSFLQQITKAYAEFHVLSTYAIIFFTI